MEHTTISWTASTWNCVTGCTRVSEGCKNCYGFALAKKWPKAFNGFQITPKPHKLNDPLKWSPRRIFVNSMSDLFHEDIEPEYLADIWRVMVKTPQHQYQVLTKRPEVALERINKLSLPLLPHIWLGVTCENQRCADIRLPILEQIPAPVRFVSAEPLLGPLTLGRHAGWINWLIVGGESGSGRRTMEYDWARALRDESLAGGIAYYYKQGNGHKSGSEPTLDGQEWHQYPEAARGHVPQDAVAQAAFI